MTAGKLRKKWLSPRKRAQLVGNLLAQGEQALATGHKEDAFRYFDEALTHDRNNASAQLSLGRALLRAGDLMSANLHLRRALDLNPTSSEAIGAFGASQRRLGRMDEAVELLTKALNLDPRNQFARVELAIALRDGLGKTSESQPRRPLMGRLFKPRPSRAVRAWTERFAQ